MKILFLCKASTKTGLGHLIRSRSLANQILQNELGIQLQFIVIGEPLVERLLSDIKFDYEIVESESKCIINESYDICFFDMTEVSSAFIDRVSNHVNLKVSISPIFNQMIHMDLFINRTKYHNFQKEELPPNVYASLDYTIIQDDCKKIRTSIYEDNLDLEQFPIAIIMGGGDAANLTLRFLKSLKDCKVPATFWVLLGEGYQHSYNELINVIKKDSDHEIILAKTNRSMWQILKNCILAILPGGITSYEAAFAGLPTINMLNNEENYFLIKELEEKEVCLYNGLINDENLAELNSTIEKLYFNRKELLQMHINSKNLIPDNTTIKILNICKQFLISPKIGKKTV